MDENRNENLNNNTMEPQSAPIIQQEEAPLTDTRGNPEAPVLRDGSEAPVLRDDPEEDAVQISEGQITAMLYDAMMGLFGEGTQLFTMEMPGRVLNQLDYAYPIEDYNSSALTKPYAVAENEFRLCDNMLDAAPIVQGPNGSRLSSTYSTLVHNYTPDISNIKEFVTDKMQLRLFLMEPITDEIDGETITCSRMEFCQRIYMKYLEQKYKWDQEKIEEHVKASDSGDLDGYAKWLATTSWTRDQELENLFQDAVIRGFYHEILTILGFLDVASPAERLAKVKANNRSSVRRSLDGSMEILPVQLQPSNWFRSLSPNFSPKDLTLDPEYLTQQYQAKRKILSSLEAELRILVMNNVTDSEIQNMEAQIKILKTKLDEEEDAFFEGYSKDVINAVKLIFDIISKGDIPSLVDGGKDALMDSLKSLDTVFTEALGLPTALMEQLGGMLYDFYKRNVDYFRTYNELVDAELEYAKMQTGDYNDQIEIIKERISILTKEVAELEVIVASGAVNGAAGSEDSDSDSLLPGSMYNEDSEFMDVVFGRSQVESMIREGSASYYSSVTGSIGCFLGSVSVRKECSLAETSFMKSVLSSDFTIGMRATKVTIDRGGWFDAGICDLSTFYRRIQEKLYGGAGLSVDSVLSAYMANDRISKGKFEALASLKVAPNGGIYLLPAFPAAFLIVKDIVIRANMTDVNQEDYEQFKKEASSQSGSLFSIRVSGGKTSESFFGLHELDETHAQFIMRIPGPQIMGWFQQLPSKDNSGKYESLSGSEYFNDMIDSLKEYSKKLKELEAERKEGNDCVTVTTIERL